MKLYNCTLEPPCPQIDYLEVQSPKDPGGSGNAYAAGYECIPLTTNASQPKWIVDAEGRMANPSMGGRIDPYYNPFDIQADCDGVTLFDSPTLMRNGPLPRPANTATPNPDEDQIFTALDYVIIDRNVVARVKWTLEEKPYDDEEYSGPYLIPAPTPAEAACFADLLDHYNFYVPFNVPGNVKCPFPYYGP
jgi:hypothetical protein